MKISKSVSSVLPVVICLTILGILLPDRFLTIAVLANYISAFALTWNLLYGFAGIFSLGHTVLIGLGGYTIGILSQHYTISPWLITPLAGVVAVIGGTLVMGFPALRLGNRHFTLLSLIVGLLAVRVVLVLSKYTGGLEGIVGFQPITVNPKGNFFISQGFLLITLLALVIIKQSILGWKLEAIRDNSLAAENSGINVARTKIIVFMISAFLAGITGAQYAYYSLVVSAQNLLELTLLTDFVVSAIIGGTGTLIGPILGGYIYVMLRETLRDLGTFRLLVFYVGTIVLILRWPGGVVGLARFFSRDRLNKGSKKVLP